MPRAPLSRITPDVMALPGATAGCHRTCTASYAARPRRLAKGFWRGRDLSRRGQVGGTAPPGSERLRPADGSIWAGGSGKKAFSDSEALARHIVEPAAPLRLGGFEAAYRLSFFSGERHAAGERERLHAARLCTAV